MLKLCLGLIFNLLLLLNQGTESLPIDISLKHCNLKTLDDSGGQVMNSKLKMNSANYPDLLIDLKFVVLHDGNRGKLTLNQIQGQVDILNDAFGGNQHQEGTDSHIRFRVLDVVYDNNKDFYYNCDKKEKEINAAYPGATDKYATIYTCEDKNYLGWAYYPWSWSEGHINQVIYSSPHTFPGGMYSSYNKGLTTVHELGHFLGLKHTFNSNGKCQSVGDDGFDDTPLEKSPNFNCNLNRDTCPSNPGNDPIWNYMDNSVDRCRNRFSPEQTAYMVWVMSNYRPKLKIKSINNYNLVNTLVSKHTSLYEYCDIRRGDGTPNKNRCLKDKRFKNICRWHDHYIKCMPLSHTDTIDIWCDVRQNNNQALTSKWKCRNKPYNNDCVWDSIKNKCFPKNSVIAPVPSPTPNPTNKKGYGDG